MARRVVRARCLTLGGCPRAAGDVRVPDAAAIGGINNGWAVANTTLMFERSGLGAGGGGGGVSALPGTIGGDLARRAGDFVRTRDRIDGGATSSTSVQNLAALART